MLDHGGLTVLLPGVGLLVHSLRFREALRPDGFRLGLAPRLDGGRIGLTTQLDRFGLRLGFRYDTGAFTLGHRLQLVPFGFGLDPLASPVALGDELQLVPFSLGRTANGGIKLPLATQDLLLLDLDLLLPFHDLHLQLLFPDLLAGLRLLERVG